MLVVSGGGDGGGSLLLLLSSSLLLRSWLLSSLLFGLSFPVGDRDGCDVESFEGDGREADSRDGFATAWRNISAMSSASTASS